MANIKITVWNKSTELNDPTVSAAIPALQIQIHRDFAPIWGVDADLTFCSKDQQPAAGSWWLVVVDDSDVAGALGYHELTDEGLPLGYVFARTDQQAGLKWTVTASHELLEMLGDPDINLYAFVQTGNNTGTFYAYEVCDPCELDEQGYQIDGVQVSDFVYPQWFEGFRAQGSTQFDYRKLIDQPFKLSPGGYASALDIPSGLGWYQINIPAPAATPSRKLQAPVGSRRERRSRTRDQWVESVMKRNPRRSSQ